jgi:hypothetical protein
VVVSAKVPPGEQHPILLSKVVDIRDNINLYSLKRDDGCRIGGRIQFGLAAIACVPYLKPTPDVIIKVSAL